MESKALTTYQRRILAEAARPMGSTTPGGYRGAGADASHWWRAVSKLAWLGLVTRNQNVATATDAGRQAL